MVGGGNALNEDSLASRIATFIHDSQRQGHGLVSTVEALIAIFGPEIAAEVLEEIRDQPYDADSGPEAA